MVGRRIPPSRVLLPVNNNHSNNDRHLPRCMTVAIASVSSPPRSTAGTLQRRRARAISTSRMFMEAVIALLLRHQPPGWTAQCAKGSSLTLNIETRKPRSERALNTYRQHILLMTMIRTRATKRKRNCPIRLCPARECGSRTLCSSQRAAKRALATMSARVENSGSPHTLKSHSIKIASRARRNCFPSTCGSTTRPRRHARPKMTAVSMARMTRRAAKHVENLPPETAENELVLSTLPHMIMTMISEIVSHNLLH